MVKPNRPQLSMPQRFAAPTQPATNIADKLAAAEAASTWAQSPVARDVSAAGLPAPVEASPAPAAPSTPAEPVAEPVEAIAGQGGDVLPITAGKQLKALMPDHADRAKSTTHLVNLSADLNFRLEALIDQIPRSSKKKLVLLAIEQFIDRTEKQLGKK